MVDITGTIHMDVPCPWCDVLNDAQNAVDGSDATPKPGDMTICASCRKIGVFDENLRLRKATPEESEAVPVEIMEITMALKKTVEGLGGAGAKLKIMHGSGKEALAKTLAGLHGTDESGSMSIGDGLEQLMSMAKTLPSTGGSCPALFLLGLNHYPYSDEPES